jgi:hypothetical protein
MNSLRAGIAALSSSVTKYLRLRPNMGRIIFLTISSSKRRARDANIQRILRSDWSGLGLGSWRKNKKKKLA